MTTTRVGVISDTHGLMRPEAVDALAGVDAILHAGDIGTEDVIARLEAIAPVHAIRGNVDRAEWAKARFPETDLVELAGVSFYLVHSIDWLDISPTEAGVDAVVFGHSHKPHEETRDHVVYLNPGSAGPRRFTLPVTLATLTLEDARITEITLHTLA